VAAEKNLNVNCQHIGVWCRIATDARFNHKHKTTSGTYYQE